MLNNKMGKKIINEQDIKTLTIIDAISQGCFTKEKLPWFTIDTDTQPKKTSTGKSVVTGKNSLGDAIWLYEIESGKTEGRGVNKKVKKSLLGRVIPQLTLKVLKVNKKNLLPTLLRKIKIMLKRNLVILNKVVNIKKSI